MTPVKIGVIGVGALGKIHLKLYRQLPEAEVVGIYDANPESCRLFGYRLEELVGMSGFALIPAELHEQLRPNLTSGKNLRYEFRQAMM